MTKKKKPPGSYTNFPVLLHVAADGTASWLNGAASYEEAIGIVSQKQNYCMQAIREKEAREQFDVFTSRVVEKRKEEMNLIDLEAKFGERARVMSKDGQMVKCIANTLGITIREARILVKEGR